MYVYIDRCGEKETPLREKDTPLGEKVYNFINAFLAQAFSGLISRRGGRWRRGTFAGGQAGTTGATWLGHLGEGVGLELVWAEAGRAGGPGFLGGAGRSGGPGGVGGRGGTLV